MYISFLVLLTSRQNPILHKNEPILPESKYHSQIYVTVDGSGTGHEAHGMPRPLLVHSSCPGTAQVFICVQGLVFIK